MGMYLFNSCVRRKRDALHCLDRLALCKELPDLNDGERGGFVGVNGAALESERQLGRFWLCDLSILGKALLRPLTSTPCFAVGSGLATDTGSCMKDEAHPTWSASPPLTSSWAEVCED